jgi:hypothetical protein
VAIWYILWPFGNYLSDNLEYFLPLLVQCDKENLATPTKAKEIRFCVGRPLVFAREAVISSQQHFFSTDSKKIGPRRRKFFKTEKNGTFDFFSILGIRVARFCLGATYQNGKIYTK